MAVHAGRVAGKVADEFELGGLEGVRRHCAGRLEGSAAGRNSTISWQAAASVAATMAAAPLSPYSWSQWRQHVAGMRARLRRWRRRVGGVGPPRWLQGLTGDGGGCCGSREDESAGLCWLQRMGDRTHKRGGGCGEGAGARLWLRLRRLEGRWVGRFQCGGEEGASHRQRMGEAAAARWRQRWRWRNQCSGDSGQWGSGEAGAAATAILGGGVEGGTVVRGRRRRAVKGGAA